MLLIVGLESDSPLPMPREVPLLNYDGGKSSQDSMIESPGSDSPRKVPLVNLAGSPTSKRRQPSSVSSGHTPRRPDPTPAYRSDDTPVWVPSSVPTRLTNGYRHRGGSASNSLEMELPATVYNGQFAHSRVAALQSQGRTPVHILACTRFLLV